MQDVRCLHCGRWRLDAHEAGSLTCNAPFTRQAHAWPENNFPPEMNKVIQEATATYERAKSLVQENLDAGENLSKLFALAFLWSCLVQERKGDYSMIGELLAELSKHSRYPKEEAAADQAEWAIESKRTIANHPPSDPFGSMPKIQRRAKFDFEKALLLFPFFMIKDVTNATDELDGPRGGAHPSVPPGS